MPQVKGGGDASLRMDLFAFLFLLVERDATVVMVGNTDSRRAKKDCQ